MDGAERFWRKWIKADSLEKGKVVEKLMKHVLKEIDNSKKFPERVRIVSLLFNGYFEDLYNTACITELEIMKERFKKEGIL